MTFKEIKEELKEREEWNKKHYILASFKSIFWYIRRFILDIPMWPKYIKWGFQRMFRGYDDRCYWDLGSHLAEYILPKLKHFKEVTYTYPGNKEASTPERWNKTLDKMIYSFERIVEDDFLGYWDYDRKEYIGRSTKEIKEIEKKYKEGMELFAEYFRALWD